MIWLSTMAGTQLCSIYFEIRDIEIRRTGTATEGVVRGLLGDGRCELWSEVFLGDAPRAQILPQWTDAGQVEGLDVAIDESELQQQLLTAVQSVFAQFRTLPALGGLTTATNENSRSQKLNGFLAA